MRLQLCIRRGLTGVLAIFGMLSLSACTTRMGSPSPSATSARPPVTTPDTASRTAPVIVSEQAEIVAYIPSVTPEYTKPKPARAVQVLMVRAEDQRTAGNMVAAVSNLERALRIEPRNPVLWNRLAHIRIDQQQYAMARELASKSIATANSLDTALKADNWQMIAQSRRATGDIAGAKAAEKKAAVLR